jgi:hypothetical protein
MKHLLVLGYGYSSQALSRLLLAESWRVSGTRRRQEDAARLAREGVEGLVYAGNGPSEEVRTALSSATHLLVSIPPGSEGDPVFRHFGQDIVATAQFEWIGYLSTTGVYGDHGGAWVNEATPPSPGSERSRRRLAAERDWQALSRRSGIPLQIFRLGGIYGPGRSPLDRIRSGEARRIVKPGQVFNRIHVADIAGAIRAGIAHPRSTGVFNVTDDLPAPPQDVITCAARLLGIAPPPEVPFEMADLSPMARSFYSENKRVRNDRLKSELSYKLLFPTYREGLIALLAGADTDASP